MSVDRGNAVEVVLDGVDLTSASRARADFGHYREIQSMNIGVFRALGVLVKRSEVLSGRPLALSTDRIGYGDPDACMEQRSGNVVARSSGYFSVGGVSFVLVMSRQWSRASVPWVDEGMQAPVQVILDRKVGRDNDGVVVHVDVERLTPLGEASSWRYSIPGHDVRAITQCLERHVHLDARNRSAQSA